MIVGKMRITGRGPPGSATSHASSSLPSWCMVSGEGEVTGGLLVGCWREERRRPSSQPSPAGGRRGGLALIFTPLPLAGEGRVRVFFFLWTAERVEDHLQDSVQVGQHLVVPEA